MVKAFLNPKEGYVPKVPTMIPEPIVLPAFCTAPFTSLDQESLNLLCSLDTSRREVPTLQSELCMAASKTLLFEVSHQYV